jgi:hypothetical protein
MPDEKPPKGYTPPPPPMDPFPTYQSPYPRSRDDEQNPFIQFRRFADEQVSSFFSGIPQFFGVAPPGGSEHWKREVEDIMRQRQEWEEGFRKQFEQEMEEMRLQLEKSKNEAWKSMEDAWKQHSHQDKQEVPPTPAPWWTKGKAANCPALNGQEPQNNSRKCPALYDERGQPRTELDAYEALQCPKDNQVQVFQAPAKEPATRPPRPWFSGLGWDGQQKQKLSDDNRSNSEEVPTKRDPRPGRPTSYSLWAARGMQPFDNSNETIPWLMLSPYSPIYLCNPAQSRLLKVKIQDSEGAPLQISNARFFARWYTDVDEKMAASKPWADAFEDLLSLQQTGRMVDRDNWNTWRTPSTWIHDMASRGSLGDRWAFNEQGMLAKRASQSEAASQDLAVSKEDRCRRWRKDRECRRGKVQELTTAQSEETAPGESVIVDKIADTLGPYPLFGSIISAADAIVTAVDQAAKEVQAELDSSAPASRKSGTIDEGKDSLSSNYSSSSTSSTSSPSYSYNSSDAAPSSSIISTLTTTTTRTLPDGSIETKRVLKRRFADGSEENDESIEVKNLPSRALTAASEQVTPAMTITASTRDMETQMPHKQLPRHFPVPSADEGATRPVFDQRLEPQQSPPPPRRGGGWFWN